MTDPARIASIEVRHADGSTTTWGENENDVARIPADLTFSSSMPGGFKDLQCSLLRDLQAEGVEALLDTVTVYGPGQRVAWQGRLQQLPRSTDQGGQVVPQAVGWSAHLQDDATFRFLYIDRDVNRWGAPSIDRQIQILQTPYKPFTGSTGYHAQAGATLDCVCDGYAWSSNSGRPFITNSYDSGGGLSIARLAARFDRYGSAVSASDPNWIFQLRGGADTIYSYGTSVSPNYNPNANGTTFSFAFSPPARFLEANAYYLASPAGSTDNPNYGWHLYAVNLQGPHGITEHGGAGTGPDGVDITGLYVSDMLAHALRLAAPLIRFTTGPTGTITPTDFPVAHAIFPDLTTAAEVVGKLNAFHAWDWGVWENRTFHFAPPGRHARTWVASTAEGLTLSLEGQTSDQIYNGVVVQYTDFAGATRSVGPPGAATEANDQKLQDTSPDNPANLAGIPRKWGVLSLQSPATLQGAVAIGQAWMLEQARATRKGQATVTGTICDDAGALHPAWAIRGGDQLLVTDDLDNPTPRRIIETSYTDASRTATLTLDSTAATLDAFLERIAATYVALG